jgi:hypothetical protein
MTTEQFHLRQSHKAEYIAFMALIAVVTIVGGLSLHWLVGASIHFLLYFPVYICAYISAIYYANKFAIDPVGWRVDMHVLLALIGVCVVCMSIVYVAHEEVGSIYVAAFFQAAFAYVAFSSAQFHINRRDKKRLKLKVKKEMKGR